MVKKQKEETPNVNSTANRDIVQRLNFLYQASVYLQSIAPPPSVTTTEHDEARTLNSNMGEGSSTVQSTTKRVKKRSKRRNVSKKGTSDLARSYVQCMHVVGQKTTVKMDPSLKRTLCLNCCTTLVPGSSASVRVKTSQTYDHVIVYTCLHCTNSKRIPAPEISPPAFVHTLPDAISSQHRDDRQQLSSADTVVPPSNTNSGTKSTKKLSSPRQPPLFARLGAGHVIFRGNTQQPVDQESGFGLFLV